MLRDDDRRSQGFMHPVQAAGDAGWSTRMPAVCLCTWSADCVLRYHPSDRLVRRLHAASSRLPGEPDPHRDSMGTTPRCIDPEVYLPLMHDSAAARRHRVMAPTLTLKHVSAEDIDKAVRDYFALT